MDWNQVTFSVVAAWAAVGTVRRAWPYVRPAAMALRNVIIRDVLRRVGKLEHDLEIVQAIQQDRGEE